MYKVFFEDGSVFEDNNPLNSKWNEIPDKLIEKIEYTIGLQTLVLSGFAEYNHIVEKATLLQQGVTKPLAIYLMGRFMDKSYQVMYDIKEGKVFQGVVEYGKEYNDKPVTGWKRGLIGLPDISLKKD